MLILSEISDIHNCSSAVKVAGFVGVGPSTYQLDKYNNLRTSLFKYSLHYLRKKSVSVHSICTYNLTFNKYYKLKRLWDKSYRCA